MDIFYPLGLPQWQTIKPLMALEHYKEGLNPLIFRHTL